MKSDGVVKEEKSISAAKVSNFRCPVIQTVPSKLRCHDITAKKDGCSLVNKMISTLRHYSKLDVSADDADRAEFVHFMSRDLHSLLEDYVHILECHPASDVEVVQRLKSAEFELFSACDASNCLMLAPKMTDRDNLCPAFGSAGGCKWGSECLKSHSDPNSVKLCDNFLKPEGCPFQNSCYFRHQTWPQNGGASTPATGRTSQEEMFVFFRDLMDSMHCFLIHSHDIEFRIKVRHRSSKEDNGPRVVDEAKWRIWGDDRFRFKNVVRFGQTAAFRGQVDIYIFKGDLCVSRSDGVYRGRS